MRMTFQYVAAVVSVWNVWNTQKGLARCSIVDIDSKEKPQVMFHRSSSKVWRDRVETEMTGQI